VRFLGEQRPVVIITDGACEDDRVSCGAVMIDGSRKEFFGCHIHPELVARWRKGDKMQFIGQAEIYPLVLARSTWKFVDRRVLYFVDNDSARFAAIACYSPIRDSLDLLWQIALLDTDRHNISWYDRVPTLSNLSDAPSRLEFAPVVALGFSEVPPLVETWWRSS
jgi:hypothetical protein